MLLSNLKSYFIALTISFPLLYEKYWGYMACRAKLSSNWPEVKIELLIILYLHSCYRAKQLSPASSLFNVATTDSKRAIYVTRWCVFAEKRPHSHWEFFGNRAKIWVLIWSCLLEPGTKPDKIWRTQWSTQVLSSLQISSTLVSEHLGKKWIGSVGRRCVLFSMVIGSTIPFH